ncbi:amidase [Cumulibacter manganitolerans]|uniref:amidase n=1 Tax=Cumulibacter manganitolerans TaxID=1884992 RepID=UPI00129532BB|nr:amidase [Cumulibacter manganitolerans]
MSVRLPSAPARMLAPHAAAPLPLPQVLSLIDEREPVINAFVHVDPEAVAGPGAGPGRLAGRIVAVKDNIAVAGAPWAAGSASRLDHPASRDAEAVRRLRHDGATVIGTTNLDEFAMGASTDSSYCGTTRNPWDVSRTAGGSSGGSAAAVAAYGVLAVGTDTGGSIREPASQCGVVGVKPSSRAIPLDGVVPFASSCDAVGPLGPDVAGTAVLDDVLRGTDHLWHAARRGARSARLPGLRVGVVLQQSDGRNTAEVRRCFERALALLASSGADLGEVSFPSISQSLAVYMDVTSAEAVRVLSAHEHRGGGLGAEAARRLEHGRSIRGTRRLRRAQQDRATIRRQLLAAADRYDVLVSPTMPVVAPRLGASGVDDPLGVPRTDWWTVEANLADLGALSVPAGLGVDTGLPVGLQVMAAPGRDERLYRVAGWLEARGVGDPC